MSVKWRPAASAEFRTAVGYLKERNPVAACEFSETIARVVSLLDRRPQIARPSNYPGFRVWSLPKWHKVIVFREIGENIEIAAVLDTRQVPPRAIE